MSFKKAVIGMGFTIAMLTNGAKAGTPQVFLTVVDTVLYPNVANPNGTDRLLTIRMNNPVVHVGAFSVSLSISDPTIINFAYSDIDTVPPHWRYYTDCTPPPCHPDSVFECPDTCFQYNAQVVTQGTRSASFDQVISDRLSETVLQVNGIVQTGGPGPTSLPPGDGVLFRVPLTIFPISDTVPLAQRQVKIFFDSIFTNVSDTTGNTLWRADSTASLSLTHGTVTVPFSMKGDCNFDGILSASDAVFLLGWVFLGSPRPLPAPSVGDVNCDGMTTAADVVLEVNRVFLGSPFPC